ncbi:MAG: NAD-dependent epimerase/dehydratase family protein [Puniceicoccaceae bacterium]
MKVLITGGNGFLGSHIARRLIQEGHEVRSIQRSDPAVIQQIEGVSYIQGDLSHEIEILSAFEGVDVVFHTAAFAGVWGAWEAFYQSNVEATLNVVHACQLHGVRKLVYTSTPSVVFSGKAIEGADESLPYGSNWLCHYAHTKQLAEAWVLGDDVAADLDVVALRPHLIWGAGDPHLLPRLLRRARAGGLKIVGKGTNRVDLTHVDNAADAHLLAMKQLMENAQQVRQKAYFISDGEPVVLWQWIQNLLLELGMNPIRKRVPFAVAYAAAACMEAWYHTFHTKGEPAMTRFVAVELSKHHYFDISAACRDLGYHPSVTPSQRTDLIRYLSDL